MSSFSIFKVPYLVQQLILGIAEPCELISISLCSKRAHFLVKSSYSRKSLEWRHSFVGGNNLSEVQIYSPEGPRLMVKKKAFGISRRGAGEENAPDFITELFNIEIRDAKVDGAGVAALKFLNDRQENKIHRMTYPVDFSDEGTSDEIISGPHLQSLLTDHPTTRSLLIGAITPEDFKCPEKLPPFTLLYLKHAPWITIEDIMKVDIEEITVGGDEISSLDLNRFLKHWLNGGSPKLKGLTVGLMTPDNSIFKDLEQITVFNDQPREILVMENLMLYQLPHGYDITREDGRMITVNNTEEGISLMVWPEPAGEPKLVAGIQAID